MLQSWSYILKHDPKRITNKITKDICYIMKLQQYEQ